MVGSRKPDEQLTELLQTALPGPSRLQLRTSVIPSLLGAVSQISETLRSSHRVALTGTSNAFDDEQLNVDLSAEACIRRALIRCSSIVTSSSEENPTEQPVDHGSADTDTNTNTNTTTGAGDGEGEGGPSGEQYTVAYDPLDGSSIIPANWTVGTIISIWDGDTALGTQPSHSMVASIIGVYGPRTTALVAIRIPEASPPAHHCFEFGLGGHGPEASNMCEVIRDSVQLRQTPSTGNTASSSRYFAPANLRAAAESPQYMSLIQHYVFSRYTLRYSGGLVPDVVHALVKGHGIYVSPVTDSSRAKLRRLYELCPVALVVECAGGRAVDSASGDDVLQAPVMDCDERGGLVCGNVEEVELVKEMLL